MFLDNFFDTEKPPGRVQVRKPGHSVAKSENVMDESFEDLLSKYKQIQLELECIRKQESKALEPSDPPSRDQPPPETLANVTVQRTEAEPASIQSHSATEEASDPQRTEKKVFQAFNLKPLRQKLLTPLELDALKKRLEEENGVGQEVEQGHAQQAVVKDGQEGEGVPVPACLRGLLPSHHTGVITVITVAVYLNMLTLTGRRLATENVYIGSSRKINWALVKYCEIAGYDRSFISKLGNHGVNVMPLPGRPNISANAFVQDVFKVNRFSSKIILS